MCEEAYEHLPGDPVAAGFVINTDLWVWQAIEWVEFANPLTSQVSALAAACARGAPAVSLLPPDGGVHA